MKQIPRMKKDDEEVPDWIKQAARNGDEYAQIIVDRNKDQLFELIGKLFKRIYNALAGPSKE